VTVKPTVMLAFAFAASGALVSAVSLSQLEPARMLFDGTLTGWTVENAPDGNIAVRNGVLRVEEPAGWLRAAGIYENFLLRIEFRFVTDDADSGIFVRAVADGTFGPGWPSNSYQVQLRNPIGESRFPPVGGIFRHGKPPGETDFDPGLAAELSTGTGEWQQLEIEAAGEQLEVKLNGTLLTRASGIENPRGFIGIQAETGAIEFRSIEIEPH
jgi:hypothetical protein